MPGTCKELKKSWLFYHYSWALSVHSLHGRYHLREGVQVEPRLRHSPCVSRVCSSSKLPRAPLDFSGGSRAPWDKNLSYILNYGSDSYRKSVRTWGGRCCSGDRGGFCQIHIGDQGALRWKSLEEGSAWAKSQEQ